MLSTLQWQIALHDRKLLALFADIGALSRRAVVVVVLVYNQATDYFLAFTVTRWRSMCNSAFMEEVIVHTTESAHQHHSIREVIHEWKVGSSLLILQREGHKAALGTPLPRRERKLRTRRGCSLKLEVIWGSTWG